MGLFTPRSPDMNTRTGLAPRTLPVHLMLELMNLKNCNDVLGTKIAAHYAKKQL